MYWIEQSSQKPAMGPPATMDVDTSSGVEESKASGVPKKGGAVSEELCCGVGSGSIDRSIDRSIEPCILN